MGNHIADIKGSKRKNVRFITYVTSTYLCNEQRLVSRNESDNFLSTPRNQLRGFPLLVVLGFGLHHLGCDLVVLRVRHTI
jgi:hypothetical protein